MEKQEEHKPPTIFKLLISIVIIFGLVSFSLCIAAEFKKSKKDDLRFEKEQCYLPKSDAFPLGIASLVLLIIAQITGNLLACRSCKGKQRPLAIIFQVFSWISFAVAIILVSTATSVSQTQKLGEGFINGECYIVKDGIFIGSGVLVLVTICSISASAILVMRERQVEQDRSMHS